MEPLDLAEAAACRLNRSQLQPDGDGGVFWLEQRPDLEGRTILCRRKRNGELSQVGKSQWSISSSIGGYGGRAYLVVADGAYVVLSSTHEIWFLPNDGEPSCFFTPPSNWALGDLVLTSRGLTAIREISSDVIDRSIVVMNDDGNVEVLFQGPHFLMDLRSSPEGDAVAFVQWEHPKMPWDAGAVVLALVEPEGQVKVDQVFGGVTAPSWSPRFSSGGQFSFQQTVGEWISPVVIDERGSTTFGGSADYADVPWTSAQGSHLVRMNGDLLAVARVGGMHQLEQLSNERRRIEGEPVTIVDLCETNGEVVVLAATNEHRTTLFHLDDEHHRLRPLLFEAPRTATPFQSLVIHGNDGRRIEGFLALPEGGGNPPLVVFCHGGPTAPVDPSFDPAVQVFCSRGFAVAAPNYRGSTGFGRTYRTALDGKWGIADVSDVVDYAMGLVDLGLVNGDALFIRGGSAGGFTALRALSSGKFLGATGNYACTDLLQLATVTHDFELHYLDTLLGPLPSHEHLYLERSPIHHPEALKGSVLLLQGTDDVVVPPSQTEDLVQRCREEGLDVSVVFFPGEGHGFRRASTLIKAWQGELDHYGKLLAQTSGSR
jgi:dipeptidyl aminopeptidase/acylaminoacyl peptidase